jgi:hypothetical protein
MSRPFNSLCAGSLLFPGYWFPFMNVIFVQYGVLQGPGFVIFPGTGGNRVKKRGSKFLNLTNMPTFAIPKKSVDQ